MTVASLFETMRTMPATLKSTAKGVKLLDDEGGMIAWWPRESPQFPVTLDQAMARAAVMIVRRHGGAS